MASDLLPWDLTCQNDAVYMCSNESEIFFGFNPSMPSFILKSKFSLKTSYRMLRNKVYNGSVQRLLN